ncbi:putative Protein disulfide-isomerase [Blattamonas nauphoetae]|uniref:Thioredoxin domain-containing protein n=1 Tax=Blattamonas nauphoetae TaxID=2049346 RepID=A0ABQ9WUP5_9EUKA|nr:putative Protein disulfide-isomerase [Blattamonas nauphoetae]
MAKRRLGFVLGGLIFYFVVILLWGTRHSSRHAIQSRSKSQTQIYFEASASFQPITGMPFPIDYQLISAREQSQKPLPPAEFEKGKVKTINATQLKERKKDSHVWMIKYFNPGCPHCENIAPIYVSLAKSLENVTNLHFGEVDCSMDYDACKSSKVQGVPTIEVYYNGKTKRFNGNRDLPGLKGFVEQTMKDWKQWKPTEYGPITMETMPDLSKYVTSLTSSNIDLITRDPSEYWVIKFFAPWCGHCRNFAPIYLQLAESMKDVKHLRFAEIDCEAQGETCRPFKTRGYPTVQIFHGDEKDNFVAKRTIPLLQEWIGMFIRTHPNADTPPDPALLKLREDAEKEKESSQEHPKRGEIIPLTEKVWDDARAGKDQAIRVIGFLDSGCRSCIEFTPLFKSNAELLSYSSTSAHPILIYTCDCHNDFDLCEKIDVQSTPSVVILVSKDMYTRDVVDQDEEYTTTTRWMHSIVDSLLPLDKGSGTEARRLDEKSEEEWKERLEKVKKDQAEERRLMEEEEERQFQEELKVIQPSWPEMEKRMKEAEAAEKEEKERQRKAEEIKKKLEQQEKEGQSGKEKQAKSTKGTTPFEDVEHWAEKLQKLDEQGQTEQTKARKESPYAFLKKTLAEEDKIAQEEMEVVRKEVAKVKEEKKSKDSKKKKEEDEIIKYRRLLGVDLISLEITQTPVLVGLVPSGNLNIFSSFAEELLKTHSVQLAWIDCDNHASACELLEAPVMPSAILFHSQGQIPLPDNMTLLTTALESTTTPLSFFSNALSTLPPPNITLPADLSELSPTDLRKVISTDEYCLVVFHSPFCRYCQELKDKLPNIVSSLNSSSKTRVRVYKFNCNQHSDECVRENVDRVPEIRIYHRNAFKQYNETNREEKPIVSFVTEAVKQI